MAALEQTDRQTFFYIYIDGDQSEYENERFSLTFQLSFLSNFNNLFIYLVTLINNEINI